MSLEKRGGGGLSRVVMGLGWDVRKAKGIRSMFGGGGGDIDLDASCLMFDGQRALVDQVWFRQLQSKDGSIRHTGDNRTGAGDGDDEQIVVELGQVPATVTTLMFLVNSFTGDTFERIEKATCRLVDATTDAEIARYDLSGTGGTHTAQVMARVSRDGSGWTMTAVGAVANGRTFHDMMPVIEASF